MCVCVELCACFFFFFGAGAAELWSIWCCVIGTTTPGNDSVNVVSFRLSYVDNVCLFQRQVIPSAATTCFYARERPRTLMHAHTLARKTHATPTKHPTGQRGLPEARAAEPAVRGHGQGGRVRAHQRAAGAPVDPHHQERHAARPGQPLPLPQDQLLHRRLGESVTWLRRAWVWEVFGWGCKVGPSRVGVCVGDYCEGGR